MVENAVTGLYVRRGRKFIYVNDSFCQMLGRSADELLGHELTEFSDTTPQDWQRVLQAWDRLEAGDRHVRVEATLRHKDGSKIELAISISPIEWDDGQPAVIGLVDDITNRKQAAEQIESCVQRLEASMQGMRSINPALARGVGADTWGAGYAAESEIFQGNSAS